MNKKLITPTNSIENHRTVDLDGMNVAEQALIKAGFVQLTV